MQYYFFKSKRFRSFACSCTSLLVFAYYHLLQSRALMELLYCYLNCISSGKHLTRHVNVITSAKEVRWQLEFFFFFDEIFRKWWKRAEEQVTEFQWCSRGILTFDPLKIMLLLLHQKKGVHMNLINKKGDFNSRNNTFFAGKVCYFTPKHCLRWNKMIILGGGRGTVCCKCGHCLPEAQTVCVDILSTPFDMFVLLWRERAPWL